MTICLSIFAGIILYTYFLYPLLLLGVARLPHRKTRATRDAPLPKLTFIVAAHNAEAAIEEKILNTLQCAYPEDKIEYIFVSDGCTDETDNIIKKYPSIHLISLGNRLGKEQALRQAINCADSEVLCFSDVGTLLEVDALEKLATNFSDPDVGAVSSYDRSLSVETTLESIHVWYEFLLRKLESEISSCVGVSGSLFLARMDMCKLLTTDCCSDLAITFICVKHNYRSVLEKSAYGYYSNTTSVKQEFSRKKRTIVHGINAVIKHKEVLSVFKYGFFSWQVLSHKILRWLSPVAFMVVLFLSGVKFFEGLDLRWLASGGYGVLLMALLAITAMVFLKRLRTNTWLFFAYNTALLAALIDVMRRKKLTVWQPTERR
ncbi:glycosyltransferase [Exilibacterium tricleocarpae]|uniref:Glycosyltransferase n=1 Tax=Exilibacterium tricleocarpae TaxID=2591008 RepID=A0A545UBD9_9GAMM|nr:glycosyltransferase [Exilibacterium tricleocarpae]TQV86784.1 glycosyltransferase [Exilibacterium tricleocarpae]